MWLVSNGDHLPTVYFMCPLIRAFGYKGLQQTAYSNTYLDNLTRFFMNQVNGRKTVILSFYTASLPFLI